MKKQPRFITILIGALLSGVALQATAANTINPDSGTSSEGAARAGHLQWVNHRQLLQRR